MRFADDRLKGVLEETLTSIRNRILEGKYVAAKKVMAKAKTTQDYKTVAQIFKEIGDYKDSQFLADKCSKTAKEIFIEEKYKTAILNAENALHEQDFWDSIKTLESLGDYKDAVELKRKYEESWNSCKETAMAIWKEFSFVNDKIISITKEINRKNLTIENLKKEILKEKTLLQESKNNVELIFEPEARIKTIQQQITQLNSELSRLGAFAFSKKKEISVKITELKNCLEDYSNKISKIKEHIKKIGPKEALVNSIEANKRSVKECLREIELLNPELDKLNAQLEPIVEKLKNRQIIATLFQNEKILPKLAENEKVLPILLENDSIVAKIKMDDKLKYMIKSSEFFYLIPRDKQKTIFGSIIFDTEAVYYQACQALENARSIDDVKWAQQRFIPISRYKDSNSLLLKCEEMIEKNTYKM